MSAAPGVQHDAIVSTAPPYRVTVSGNTVAPSITNNGNGTWTVSIDAQDVKCPGPIKINDSGGSELYHADVCPCP